MKDIKARVLFNPDAMQQVKAAAFEGVTEVFEMDIKPAAVEGSPVLTGTNRRSIDTETMQDAEGNITATLFTQSGYGGYLETGTARMKAQPYLFPAFNRFAAKLGLVVRQKVAMIKTVRSTTP